MEKQNEQQVLEYLDKFANVFNTLVKDVMNRKISDDDSPGAMFDAEKLQALLSTPGVEMDNAKLIQNQMTFMSKQLELWQSASKAMFSGEKLEAMVDIPRGDKRFNDEDWQDNPVYSYLKQAYLLNSDMMSNMVSSLKFTDPKAEEQVKFYTRQYISSVSPSNYALTNPEVCREILESKGQNMVKGLENFIRDLEQSPAEALKITQTDPNAFTLGENIATTPGEVVFQNDLIQLIHYKPTTKTVLQTPVLITPPFINKYYILDLDKKKSLVRWLTEQGHAAFIISWVNPTAEMASKDFGDYVTEGIVAAMDAVCGITKAEKINVIGWCVGGTALACTAAYLKAKGDERINSLTFLTTLLEFTEQGELGNYISETMAPMMAKATDAKGVFDGRIMATSFSLLRENSLFWSYFVNNYLKGKDPVAFDILHWNSDSTNLPAACHKQYLELTYINNQLKTPGSLVIDGVEIDLGVIDAPCYFLSTVADHIVLWQGAYRSAKLLNSDIRFVLAGSGHIAGVINPAEGGKYPHWVNQEMPDTAEAWFEGAEQAEGSWWPDWHQWVKPMSGKKVKAWQPGKSEDFPAIEPAPGSYVKVRI